MNNKAISPLMATTLLVAFTLVVAAIAGAWLTSLSRQRALEVDKSKLIDTDKVFVVFHDCETGEYLTDGYFNVTNGTVDIYIIWDGHPFGVCHSIYEVK